jgi:uncharacterized protein (DUF1778 family)
MKVVSIRMKEDEYELYRKLARMESKDLSSFVRDKLREAVRQNMKEVNLLDRLLKLLEELPERLRTQIQMKGSNSEELNQLMKLFIYMMKFLELQTEFLIVMEVRRKEFRERVEELKQTLGVEL